MRKILFVLSFATFHVCHAQFETGKKVIGGQIGFGLSKTNNPNISPGLIQQYSSFSASLSLSRFKTPTLLNGFGFNYGYNHAEYAPLNSSAHTDNNSTIGVFVNSMRLQPLARRFYLGFTGTVGAEYGFWKSSFVSPATYSQSKNYSVYVSGGLGLLYQLDPRFLLTCNLTNLLSLYYTHSDATYHNGITVDKGNTNSVYFSSGLNGFSLNSIGIGVRYILK